MKQLLFIFLLISISIKAQDFVAVDSLVTTYPRFSNVEALATKINTDFTTDEQKVRAAFFWLAKNIRYNLKEYYNPSQKSFRYKYSSEEEKQKKIQALKNQIVANTFKTKMGVCEEYAQSFKKICDILDIEAQVIKGYVRNSADEIGKTSNSSNHAWNAVKLNDKWIILDATWAAGSEFNGKWVRNFNNYFYNIPKEQIFKTHLPEESIWVLRFGRMSLTEFYNQPIYTNSFLALNAKLISPKTGVINVNDSGKIELKFKNLPANLKVSYVTEGNRYAQKPIIKREKNITTLTIKNVVPKSNLVLFINKNDAIHFKIN